MCCSLLAGFEVSLVFWLCCAGNDRKTYAPPSALDIVLGLFFIAGGCSIFFDHRE